jgi:hypothetical protein
MPLPAPCHTTKPARNVLTDIWTSSDIKALWEARNELDGAVGWRYRSSSASDSASGSDMEGGITFQNASLPTRPRKPTQRYTPTARLVPLQNDRIVSSGHSPAYIRGTARAERTGPWTDTKQNTISKKRKKRVVREGTCCNCGCDQVSVVSDVTSAIDLK